MLDITGDAVAEKAGGYVDIVKTCHTFSAFCFISIVL